MHVRLRPSFLCSLTLAAAAPALLAQAPAPPDTARVYSLQEVVVRGARSLEAGPATVQRLAPAEIQRADADAAAGLAHLIPAAHVPTNSRGETILYLRNSGERQAAFFLDGALLNVPWDNRVDLSLLPASVVGSATVAKGPASIEYGANVLGGVLNFLSPAVYADRTRLSGRLGTQQHAMGAVLHTGTAGRFGYAGALGYVRNAGIPVAASADLPFGQTGDLRTNTDARIANAYARGAYRVGQTRVGVTLLHVDAEKGVAPEAHLDPAEASPRYWRYPEWRSTLGVLSGEGRFGAGAAWKAAAWASRFGQHIEAYGDAAYETPATRQQDDDRTGGARFTLRQPLGSGALRLTASALTSTHAQQDLALDAAGQPVAAVPTMRYRQQQLGGGVLYEADVAGLHVEAGAGYDVMRMPETGDKPPRDAFTDYNLTLGARYDADSWFARAAAGRKTRFPTMRELFGEALRRFLLNPDLEPESSWLVEAGVGRQGRVFTAEVIPFATFTRGTIDQRNVRGADGVSRRQRINLRGSRVVGAEVVGQARPLAALEVSGHLTVMDVRRLRRTPDEPARLAEKPAALGRFAVAYDAGRGLTGLVEGVYTGRAYSLAPDDAFVPLNRALVLNARLGYRVQAARSVAAEVFGRLDNATDALVTPQLGLPGPGRSAQVGLQVSF